VPIVFVPWDPMMLQVTVPAPSPLRTDALSITAPLTVPPFGSVSRTTGVVVAGAHVRLIDGVC